MKRMHKGTILFQGDKRKGRKCLANLFRMRGQRGSKTVEGEMVAFYTSDEDTARVYAGLTEGQGWVHQFELMDDVSLLYYDWSNPMNMDLVDTEEVAQFVCPTVRGIYIWYGEGKPDEVALCSPETLLTYRASKRSGDQWWRNYKC